MRLAPANVSDAKTMPMLGQNFNFAFNYVGAPERILEYYERRAQADFVPGFPIAYLWQSAFASVRKTERFKALMSAVGLVDYWKVKGWPDQCHPTTGEDFECS